MCNHSLYSMGSDNGGSLPITCPIATSLRYIILSLNILKYTRIRLHLRTLSGQASRVIATILNLDGRPIVPQ